MLSHKKDLLKALTFLCCIVSFMTACFLRSDNAAPIMGKGDTPLTDVTENECAVYSQLLKIAYVGNDASPLVIEKVSSLDGISISRLNDELGDLHRLLPLDEVDELTNRFVAANEYPSTLDDCFKLEVQPIFLSKEEIDEITKAPNGWGAFHAKSPHKSLIWLSRIAFNREVNKALVYTGKESGGKSGQGSFVLFTKENGAWILKYTIVSWKS